MGTTVDIILTTTCIEPDVCVKQLSTYIQKLHPGVKEFTPVHQCQYVEDIRQMEDYIYIAAVKSLDVDNFVSFFKIIQWKYPESIQLFVKPEYYKMFEIHVIPE